MRSVLLVLLGMLAFVASGANGWAGLTVNGYSAATADRYDRFNNSAEFLGNPYDWSGIGRTASGFWGTLVSPSFIVSATHHQPELNSVIRFYNSNDPTGGFVERTVGQAVVLKQMSFAANSDLVLLPLSSAVTGINIYPIAAPMSPASLIGQEIYVWGQADTPQVQTAMRLGRNEVFNVIPAGGVLDQFGSVGTSFVYDFNTTTGLGPDEARVVGGDSGAPNFLIGPDGPTLVGINWFNTVAADMLTGNRDGSGATLVSSFINELNNAMAATGSSERVTVAVVPEPAMGMLLWIGTAVALLKSRRRRDDIG
jgi:hypothetical protein